MVDTHWEALEGRELRYHDHTWELTGDVDVRERGQLLAVAARQVDDVRRPAATLHFDCSSPDDSLNPGTSGEQFARLERNGDQQYLVVESEGPTYRYELRRLTYD